VGAIYIPPVDALRRMELYTYIQTHCCSVLQCVAVCCSVLQCVAASSVVCGGNTKQYTIERVHVIGQDTYTIYKETYRICKETQHNRNQRRNTIKKILAIGKEPYTKCKETNTIQRNPWNVRCAAVCCSVLQCVAVCCSVLQCRNQYMRKATHCFIHALSSWIVGFFFAFFFRFFYIYVINTQRHAEIISCEKRLIVAYAPSHHEWLGFFEHFFFRCFYMYVIHKDTPK